MVTLLQDRVQERLDVLKISAFEADRRAGFKRGFVHELLIGRKHGTRDKSLAAMSAALECDPGYLTGVQSTPRLTNPGDGAPIAGTIEPGAWREPTAGPLPTAPIAPVMGYPPEQQQVFAIRGGNFGGGFVQVLTPPPAALREGDQLIARRRKNGLVELSMRQFKGDRLVPCGYPASVGDLSVDEVEIVGLVIAVTMLTTRA